MSVSLDPNALGDPIYEGGGGGGLAESCRAALDARAPEQPERLLMYQIPKTSTTRSTMPVTMKAMVRVFTATELGGY